jgi:hypothetical protein
VNEFDTPPPDWEAVFHRARRRMFGRLLLVGVLAALGAGLLLNGGLAAQGSAPWLPINKETDSKSKQKHEKNQGKHGQRQHNGGGHNHNDPKHKQGKKKSKQGGHGKHKGHKHWNPCRGDSAGTEYCDAPAKTPDRGPTGKTDTSTGGVAESGEVAPTGEIAPVPEN